MGIALVACIDMSRSTIDWLSKSWVGSIEHCRAFARRSGVYQRIRSIGVDFIDHGCSVMTVLLRFDVMG